MVTYNELLNAQPGSYQGAASAWSKWANAARGHETHLGHVNDTVANWKSLAGSTAKNYVQYAGTRAGNSATALSLVSNTLDQAYASFADAHNDLLTAVKDAQGDGFTVDGHGKVHPPAVDAKHTAATKNVYAQSHPGHTMDGDLAAYQKKIDDAVSQATNVDNGLASALRRLKPGGGTSLASSDGSGPPGTHGTPASPVSYPRHGDIPVPPNALSNAPNPGAKAVLKFALSKLGDPYVWGATGPNSFDCSGLTSQAYAAAGMHIPRTSEQQWAAGPRIPDGSEQPGDLVYFEGGPNGPGHVGIVLDPAKGTMVVAPHTGDVVKIQDYRHYPGRVGFTRPGGH